MKNPSKMVINTNILHSAHYFNHLLLLLYIHHCETAIDPSPISSQRVILFPLMRNGYRNHYMTHAMPVHPRYSL